MAMVKIIEGKLSQIARARQELAHFETEQRQSSHTVIGRKECAAHWLDQTDNSHEKSKKILRHKSSFKA
ncbi:hypothetical protein [Agrobacterium sp.]|uniref:hypothetical protein n=1 Tax=Agrobacterium sp. TaxID=361 RepID=UPI0028AC9EBC